MIWNAEKTRIGNTAKDEGVRNANVVCYHCEIQVN